MHEHEREREEQVQILHPCQNSPPGPLPLFAADVNIWRKEQVHASMLEIHLGCACVAER